MKPLKIILLCGPTASGKSFATERLLSVNYDVATAKLDSFYRSALEHAGVPREDGKPYSVFVEAHALREGAAYDQETSERFIAKLDELVQEQIRQASSWGVGLVLEGYTLRFADEVGRIVQAARATCGRKFSVSRVHMRPTLDVWNHNRAEVGKLKGSRINVAEPAYYERTMGSPEPVEDVEDHTVSDLDELKALVDEVIQLRPHKWYQRFELGPISTTGPSDASEKVGTMVEGDVAGRQVLDLCCATGVHAIMIKNRGAAKVVGVEMHPARYCKSLELRKTLLRHSEVDARVTFRFGDISAVLPELRRFDTVAFFGALHYFPDYQAILESVAQTANEAVYIEFCFAEGEHDSADAPGEIRPYTRSRTGTTIYMGDRETVTRTIERAMPDFELEERIPISAPGAKLVSQREVWRLRRRHPETRTTSGVPT